jgi:hypothetical protein
VPAPIGQGHVLSRRKERESNPQGCHARPASNGVPSPVGLPFRFTKAAVAGIEPASGRLTAAYPYQHGSHRIVSFSQDGWIRTSDLVLPGHAECQAFPRPETNLQSAQRESNPHVRHGKATGCRYIMGAWLEAELSRIDKHPAAAAFRLLDQWDRWASNPHRPV